MKSVTIAIPTFNRPRQLEIALQSASSQDYENLNIVVSDNASTGHETRQVVEAAQRADRRISLHVQDANTGGKANFVWLLNHAVTDLFMWLADDDELMGRDFVSKLVQYFDGDTNAQLVFPDVDIVYAKSTTRNVLNRHFTNCLTDADYLSAWCRFGGGYPFYGLFKLGFLRELDLGILMNGESAYHNEGLILHKAFIRGGARFCREALLRYNGENSGVGVKPRTMLGNFLTYSKSTHLMYLTSDLSTQRKLRMLRHIGNNHYPYIGRLLKRSILNQGG